MRGIAILLSFTLFFCSPVYASGAEACELFQSARKATFEGGTVQLSGSGTITGSAATDDEIQKSYQMIAQIRDDEETRLRLSIDNEIINLILTDGNIYNDRMTEQKAGALFAKMVYLGVLDPFFILEIISGKRAEMYSPYMSVGPGGTLQLNLSPGESAALYEHWTADFHGFLGAAADGMSDKEISMAEGLLRQILTALDVNVKYTFHIDLDSLIITQIDIQSEIAAPEVRYSQAVIQVLTQHNPQSNFHHLCKRSTPFIGGHGLACKNSI